MAQSTLPPAPVDGSTGNLLQRAEPKVKASAIVALLTPLVLYYLHRYVPGASSLPTELDVVLGTLITGATTFAAGYLARAADRIDLFGKQLAAAVTRAGDETIGATATDELEDWTKKVAGKVAGPVKTAVVDAVHAVEAAAEHGEDPVAAAEDQVPDVVDAAKDAVTEAADEVEAAAAPAVADLAVAQPKTPEELMAELRKMLALLDAGTPIGDAAQPAAPAAVPAPADPPTAPMQAVAAAPAA